MTIKSTVIISILFHSFMVCVGLLSVRSIPLLEKTILVELESPARDNSPAREGAFNPSRAKGGVKPLVAAPPEKKGLPARERKRRSSAPDESAGDRVAGQAPAETGVSLPAGSTDDAPEGGRVAGQGGSASGTTEGISVFLNGNGGVSRDPSPGAGGHDRNATGRIREAIERAKVYPALARKRRQEGTVVTEFSINARGLPEDIRVIRSSGFNLLDSAAKDTIARAAPFPPVNSRIEVPITFVLTK